MSAEPVFSTTDQNPTNEPDERTEPRRRLPLKGALGLAALIALGFAFKGPLIAWFKLEPMGGGGSSAASTTTAGELSVEAALSPDPPREKGNALLLTITDPDGEPVTDADVAVQYSMPAMGSMPEMRGSADVSERGDARYRAEFDLPMGGSWTLEVDIDSPAGDASLRYNMTVGTSGLTAVSGAGSGAPSAAQDAPRRQELPAPMVDALRAAFDAADGVRARLAADDPEVAAEAAVLAEALTAAQTVAVDSSEVAECLEDAIAAARALQEGQELAEARRRFGEVMRGLVALADTDPRLQEGWHIFECSMASGFNKWFQRSEQLENPYQGRQMLTCGDTSSWSAAVSQGPAGGDSHDHSGAGDEIAHYTCPMHPNVEQERAGQCPICNMDLVPVTEAEASSPVLTVDDARRQKIGVKTAAIERRPVTTDIRALGRIAFDETRLHDVTLKYKGWIEKLHVETTGQEVKKGQRLLSLYSPEIYAAKQEYALALRSQERARKSGNPERSDYLVRASRKRLKLLDVGAGKSGRVSENVGVSSPVSGFVVEKMVVEGAAVEPGQTLYRIAGLDEVWVEAEVFESDLPKVAVGQEVTVTLDTLPGETFTGTIQQVVPFLDAKTRTGRVRISLPNPDLKLKPDMYANVDLSIPHEEKLMVPASAVIYTGPRRIVFVDLGDGKLRPQEVTLGTKSGQHYEVISGLNEGDVVVTSGNFLIASESRIRSALEYWSAEPAAKTSASATEHDHDAI